MVIDDYNSTIVSSCRRASSLGSMDVGDYKGSRDSIGEILGKNVGLFCKITKNHYETKYMQESELKKPQKAMERIIKILRVDDETAPSSCS